MKPGDFGKLFDAEYRMEGGRFGKRKKSPMTFWWVTLPRTDSIEGRLWAAVEMEEGVVSLCVPQDGFVAFPACSTPPVPIVEWMWVAEDFYPMRRVQKMEADEPAAGLILRMVGVRPRPDDECQQAVYGRAISVRSGVANPRLFDVSVVGIDMVGLPRTILIEDTNRLFVLPDQK